MISVKILDYYNVTEHSLVCNKLNIYTYVTVLTLTFMLIFKVSLMLESFKKSFLSYSGTQYDVPCD